MSGLSPGYFVARDISNNLGSGFKQVKDENFIEKVLAEAGDDPDKLKSSIGQILSQVSPERQGAAVAYLQDAYQNVQAKKQQAMAQSAAKEAGYTYGAPAGVQTQQVKDRARNAELSRYGLGGNQDQQQVPNNLPVLSQQNQQFFPGISKLPSPQESVPQSGAASPSQYRSPFRDISDDKLLEASGAPYKEISEPAKQEIKRRLEESKEDRTDKRENRKEQVKFHNETQKYDEELIANTRRAKSQIETVKDIEKAVKSGKVKPSSWANILKGFGPVGNKISEALLNNDESTLLSSIPQLLEGWKEVFGVRLSDADLRLLQDKLPSIGKSPEANLAVTRILRKYADMTLLRGQIATEIKQKNNGLRPLGYADQIEKRFDEMVAPVRMINPNNGNEISVPAYKVSEAIQAGAKLVNE